MVVVVVVVTSKLGKSTPKESPILFSLSCTVFTDFIFFFLNGTGVVVSNGGSFTVGGNVTMIGFFNSFGLFVVVVVGLEVVDLVAVAVIFSVVGEWVV